ncbi:uncharacterized protein A4U43_C06F15920 [Asparagus officinalis]|uniref:Uncharacterized protein n=1 Tax=Asparagus officinalis TaxID=4686 RepID=A0A5P1EST2_ASPOF|nr:uncharacterized protein A4U43_C06F15920 [Asparagus officinalis]
MTTMVSISAVYHSLPQLLMVQNTSRQPLLGLNSRSFVRIFLIYRFKTPVDNALRDAKLSFKDLDEVILVRGLTCIPAVQELVKKMTEKNPNVTVNPDEVVALGAAVQARVLAGDVSD